MSMDTHAFTAYESNIRSYCRSFPVVFQKAKGAYLFDEEGRRYIDFFAGAGALNYGHNHDFIKEKIIQHIQNDFVMHALDMYTVAKREFLNRFHDTILGPRNLNFKVQFTGPTGTNAVEAALKLARKVTGRRGVFAFQGGFHGMSLGALACTGNKYNRNGAAVDLPNVTFMPYPHGFTASFDTIEYMDYVLNDENSGIETPAAIILETIQAEGG
ncbi:MAG TPA: aminotransferase class III-fold pyridoxal phosphate-dependent enzyme, partial [Pseudomonadales bacterium]|nr:aminotransferase class III-fold pyridoxal phosphate-dependent enzyme [Pseudomonadales bacterium]